MPLDRREFFTPAVVVAAVREKLRMAQDRGEPVDYLSFVPDGEPTLDVHLGEEIEALQDTGIRLAVISNSSLIDRPDVREELSKADWVSLKVDAVSEDVWRRVDRPHRALELGAILLGIAGFARDYGGELTTETMLVRGVNDDPGELERIADFVAEVRPTRSYLSIPTRPPSEAWVEAASEQTLAVAFELFTARGIDTEYLVGYEGNSFAWTGNAADDLLSITAVHPMREDAVDEYLRKAGEGREPLERLVADCRLVRVTHGGHTYYVRKLPSARGSA
jgi:wyosine [tRNA(Phe)-imidazoG37] synthetase (radical SAM superfamily)